MPGFGVVAGCDTGGVCREAPVEGDLPRSAGGMVFRSGELSETGAAQPLIFTVALYREVETPGDLYVTFRLERSTLWART